MTARVAAGRLGHVDVGKTITVPTGGVSLTGELVAIVTRKDLVTVDVRFGQYVASTTVSLSLTPHQLVSVTGKEAAAA